jgi:EmrB/QacA subfamily drug resistance transporter
MIQTIEADPSTGRSSPLSQRQLRIVFGGLMLGMLLAALDQTIVATALPTIVGDLGGLNHLSWVVTAYLLTSTAVTPLWGKLSDLYGRRGTFQAAIVIFLAGSMLSGLAQNMGELIGFRAVQGLGGGGLMALAMAIVGDLVSPRERGRYQGYFGAVFAVASVSGPLLGGYFTDQLSWRWIFYVNLPLGIAALAVTTVVLRIPFRRQRRRIDYLGSLLLVAAVSCIVTATTWGGITFPWGSVQIIGLAVAAVALLALFVAREARASEPILPLHLFRNPIFAVAGAITGLLGLALFGAVVYLPEYLQVVKGASAISSGLQLIPLTMGIVIASTACGQLVSRIGRYKVFPIIGAALLAIGFWLHPSPGHHQHGRALGVDAGGRARHRLHHADRRAGRPERRRVPGPRDRHLGHRVLPPAGRRTRHRAVRRRPAQPAPAQPGRPDALGDQRRGAGEPRLPPGRTPAAAGPARPYPAHPAGGVRPFLPGRLPVGDPVRPGHAGARPAPAGGAASHHRPRRSGRAGRLIRGACAGAQRQHRLRQRPSPVPASR